MKHRKILAIIVIVALVGLSVGIGVHYYDEGHAEPLIMFVADAYVGEANYLLSGYHNATKYPVSPAIGGGSYTDANKIGAGDPANVFMSVALSPYGQNYLKDRYSGWAIAFASDQLVLAYYNDSQNYKIASDLRMSELENNSAMFVSALDAVTSKSNSLGISDPSTDPAGLRAWISLEIAGKVYANNESHFVSNVKSDHANVTRSSAAQLVPALETGEISFLFIYRSAAVHSGLDFVELPEKLSFGNPTLASFYAGFTYNTSAGTEKGSPVLLYITSLANNSLSSQSLNFVLYTIDNRDSMNIFDMNALSHPELFNNTYPPQGILKLVSSGEIIRTGGIN